MNVFIGQNQLVQKWTVHDMDERTGQNNCSGPNWYGGR